MVWQPYQGLTWWQSFTNFYPVVQGVFIAHWGHLIGQLNGVLHVPIPTGFHWAITNKDKPPRSLTVGSHFSTQSQRPLRFPFLWSSSSCGTYAADRKLHVSSTGCTIRNLFTVWTFTTCKLKSQCCPKKLIKVVHELCYEIKSVSITNSAIASLWQDRLDPWIPLSSCPRNANVPSTRLSLFPNKQRLKLASSNTVPLHTFIVVMFNGINEYEHLL